MPLLEHTRTLREDVAAPRVLVIPGEHRYVRFAIGDDPGHVEFVRDLPADSADALRWAPSPALEPTWVRKHRQDIDLVHLHFGFEGRSPAQLAEWARTLRDLQIPLVVTVHDLQLPHVRDQSLYRRQLAVLVAAADDVITLTAGAARQIGREYGRDPIVVSHPRMVPLREISHSARSAPKQIRVGIHLKSLRANVARECVPAVAEAVARLRAGRRDVELIINAHREIRDPGFVRYDAATVATLDRASAMDGVHVRWHERFTDHELGDYLRGLQVSVLPHRWGSHSGWLEECRDLGVVPVAGDVGYLEEQSGTHTFRWAGAAPDPASLDAALRAAMAEAAAGRSPAQAARWATHRARTDRGSQHAHRTLYCQLMGRAVHA